MKPFIAVLALFTCFIATAQNQKLQLNHCIRFFNDTVGKGAIHFKSVTTCQYSYADTAIDKKKLEEKNVYKYGKYGEPLAAVTYDLRTYNTTSMLDSAVYQINSLNMTDSTIYEYSNNYRDVRQIKYKEFPNWDDVIGVFDGFYIYDSSGNLIKDSTWQTDQSYISGNYYSSVWQYKYDKVGHLIWKMYATKRDTTIYTYAVYKNESKLVCERGYRGGSWEISELNKYDSAGNKIKSMNLTFYRDTIRINRVFGPNSKLVKEERYKNSTLESFMSLVYNKDSSSVLTNYRVNHNSSGQLFNNIFGFGPDYSCPYENKSVTLFDKDSNKLCDTLFTYKGQETDTMITLEKYHRVKGKLIHDSEIMIDKAYLFSSKSVHLFKYKYDSDSNVMSPKGLNLLCINGHIISRINW